MKKILFFLSIFFLLCSPAFAMTYANEPKNHDGIPWSSRVEEIGKFGKQLTFKANLTEQNVSIYARTNQSLNIFNKHFDEITYHFYKGQFFMVKAIKFNDLQMSRTLLQKITSEHGTHTQQNELVHQKTTVYHWQGNTTTIVLSENFKNKITTLTFYNHPLYQNWYMLNKTPSQTRAR